MCKRVACVVLSTILLAGSVSLASGAEIRPGRLVLDARDLPAGFKREEAETMNNVRAAVTPPQLPLEQLRRWQRRSGYTVVYRKWSRRLGYVASIRSSVSIYRAPSGAQAALRAKHALQRSWAQVALAEQPSR